MPSKVKMKMNINNRTAKVLISIAVTIIFYKRIRKDVHERANLNTLKSLTALNTEMAPLLENSILSALIIFSTIEMTTMMQSKILKPS